MKHIPPAFMHQSELRRLIGGANQRDAAVGYRYRTDNRDVVRFLLPFVNGHKRTLFARAEAEAFVADLLAGRVEFIRKIK